MNVFSTSMKRATIMFVRPGFGKTIVQENAGKVDSQLRIAIEKARKVFLKEYEKGSKLKRELSI